MVYSRLRTVRTLLAVLSLSMVVITSQSQVAAKQPVLGVFYFPGWKDDALGLVYPKPWEPIKKFPEREPLLGWYDEGSLPVMEQQLDWMSAYGLGFVVFDWYWGGEREVLGHAVAAYHASNGKRRMPYALMWANHGAGPKTEADFVAMGRELIEKHFSRPEYLKVGGKPLLYFQVPENLEAKARAFGRDSTALIAGLQRQARQAGLPGVLVLAGAGGGPGPVPANARRWGYEAYFTYNYHAGIGGRTRGEARFSHSYAELDEGYQEHWNWFITKGDLPYVVPMTSGWDKRPWGGSKEPAHDRSVATQSEFRAHLRRGRELIAAYPDKTLGMGIVCCWNEFGEGSYIEPTKAQRFQYLEAIKAEFGNP